jgi:UDP-glucose 4-epimerase
MERIVIIGKESYIGQHIKGRFLSEKNPFQVRKIDARDGNWKDEDYFTVDTVIHVAGIVHRPDVTDWNLYKIVNIELPIAVAQTAKAAGAKQFVFLNTMGGVHRELSNC